MQRAEANADGVRSLPLPGADVHDLGSLKPKPVSLQVGHDRRHLQVHAGCRLGVGITQTLGEPDQFFQVFRVGGEMLLVAPIVDRIQGRFLKDEGSVDDVPDRPLAFAVLPIPLTLAGGALPRATDLMDDNYISRPTTIEFPDPV